MSKYTRKSMQLDLHDVTGGIDRVIEYLTGVKKALEAQGCIGIQFNIGYDSYEDKISAEVSMEVDDASN
jgi:hypothetical protein